VDLSDPAKVQERLAILTTEHWSLLTSRSQLWNEAFSRGAMFLTVVSGSVVALALVAQATKFGPEFTAAALLLLPIDLFVGVSTFVRIAHSNIEDRRWVRAINRVRHAYLEIAPDLAPYFTTSRFDDPPGVAVSYGYLPGRRGRIQGALTTGGVVAVVNGVLAGTLVSLSLDYLGLDRLLSVLVGVVAFSVTVALLALYQHRTNVRGHRTDLPRFPTPGA
jgi:hypothetical protein